MDEWVWSNGGMILTGEYWSTGRKTLYNMGGRWINEYGAMVEWYWQGNTEVLGGKHYTAWVVDEWMSMEQSWNDTDRRQQKWWEKVLAQCHTVYQTPTGDLICLKLYTNLIPNSRSKKFVSTLNNNQVNPNYRNVWSVWSFRIIYIY